MSKLLKQIKAKNERHCKEIFEYLLILDEIINADEIVIAQEYVTICCIDNFFYAFHFSCNANKDFNIKQIKEINEDLFYKLQALEDMNIDVVCKMLGFDIYEDKLLTINPN
jgi:hypothetical protein